MGWSWAHRPAPSGSDPPRRVSRRGFRQLLGVTPPAHPSPRKDSPGSPREGTGWAPPAQALPLSGGGARGALAGESGPSSLREVPAGRPALDCRREQGAREASHGAGRTERLCRELLPRAAAGADLGVARFASARLGDLFQGFLHRDVVSAKSRSKPCLSPGTSHDGGVDPQSGLGTSSGGEAAIEHLRYARTPWRRGAAGSFSFHSWRRP